MNSEHFERAETEPHNGPNLVLFVYHGVPFPLEWYTSPAVHEHASAIGEVDALTDALGEDIATGVWVAELALVDDGPSDWPGARDSRLDATSIRPATAEEWAAHVRGDVVWWGGERGE